jgi:hypothetical protein
VAAGAGKSKDEDVKTVRHLTAHGHSTGVDGIFGFRQLSGAGCASRITG